MSRPFAQKPLYEQIKDYILLNIQSGMFQPDTRIPSERELSEQFSVSRMTVTKALAELTHAGILYARVGKGTFVSAERIDQQLEALTSFSEDMSRRGQRASSRVLLAREGQATEDVARYLGGLPGLPIIILQRVRLADDEPIALETCTLNAALCPRILQRHDFAHESLYGVLRAEYGILMRHAEQTLEARAATEPEARALEISPGSPILSILRVTYSDEERPVELVRSAYRGDRYKFHAVLRKVE
jgi:GntR family transcriptional regulator